MTKENAIDEKSINEEFSEVFEIDDLDKEIQSQLEEQLLDFEFLKEEKEQIENPDKLGSAIMAVVWEQFLNQIAVKAGEDFIKENYGLHLDLSDEAHILTPDNFEHGNMPIHNPNKENYQQRYNEYRNDLQTDPNIEFKVSKNMRYNNDKKIYERYDKKTDSWIGKTRYNDDIKVWEDWDQRARKWKKKLNPNARDKFDTRTTSQKGSSAVAKDHTISVAEQIRDVGAAAYVDRERRKNFAKSDVNLNDLDSRANSSKNDLTMDEWLNSEKNGKKPSERFEIDEETLHKQDAKAREEYEKMKCAGKNKTIQEGKKSQKEEAFRIGGKALRAVAMQLLAELIKEMIGQLIKWFKNSKKNIKSLIESFKTAIKSFISKLKQHMINAGNALLTTVASAIIGPAIEIIKKLWIALKQTGKSLKDSIDVFRNPKNNNMPITIKILEVGKIVMTGLSSLGALTLGEIIENNLMIIPAFAIEIPLLGSLANIIGIFMGAVIAGIIGAIVIYLINKLIEKKRKQENTLKQIEKANDILEIQYKIKTINKVQLERDKNNTHSNGSKRHQEAIEIMKNSLNNVMENINTNFWNVKSTIITNKEDTNKQINKTSDDLDDLLKSLS